MRVRSGWLLVVVLFAACKRAPEAEDEAPRHKAKPPAVAPSTAESDNDDEPAAPPADPTRPRYLRTDRKGALVDAFRFRSVPASIVEQEVGAAASRSDVAGILRRFGLSALEGHTGEVWIAKASLVDRLERERILVASFRGDPTEDGMREENDWLVFLGSTKEDRVLSIGQARIAAKTAAASPVEVDARELHSKDVADVVATWSSCGASPGKPPSEPKACHALRAWTMQRGRPELIADVTSELAPVITGANAPHGIVVDGRVLGFDEQAFTYK